MRIIMDARKVLVVITGASRGFGRALATAGANALKNCRPTYLLLARDTSGLEATSSMIKSAHPQATVITHTLDLSALDSIDSQWADALTKLEQTSNGERVDAAYLFSNHGSLGEIGAVRDLQGLAGLRKAIDMNVTSTLWLSTLFLLFARGPSGPKTSSAIVNVSSLAAVAPQATMSVYCTGKAARDMLHSVIAAEENDVTSAPVIKTLNYAPGPMQTDMGVSLREDPKLHAPTKQIFNTLAAEGSYVNVDDSAQKCWRILLSDSYQSGAHIDFFDAEPAAAHPVTVSSSSSSSS